MQVSGHQIAKLTIGCLPAPTDHSHLFAGLEVRKIGLCSLVTFLCLVLLVTAAAPALAQMDIEVSAPERSNLRLVKPVTKLDELLKARRLTVDGKEYLVQVERHLQFADEPVGTMNAPEYSVAVSRAGDTVFRATQDDMDEASVVRFEYCDELGFAANGGGYVTGSFEPGSSNDRPDWNFIDGCVFDGVVE